MRLTVLKSKLHLATVTRSDLHYHGSLTIDPDLMDAVSLLPYEAILVSNVATGHRAETYVLPGVRGTGAIELNGAMARLGSVGDRVIVMAFGEFEPEELEGHQPRAVALDERNRIVERIDYSPVGRACDPGPLDAIRTNGRGSILEHGAVGPEAGRGG
ncbi:MAG: aspartate 1-decarboxylase [Isosphaeraceae bacterium]